MLITGDTSIYFTKYYWYCLLILILHISITTPSVTQSERILRDSQRFLQLSCWLKFREEVGRKLVAASQLYSQSYRRVEIEQAFRVKRNARWIDDCAQRGKISRLLNFISERTKNVTNRLMPFLAIRTESRVILPLLIRAKSTKLRLSGQPRTSAGWAASILNPSDVSTIAAADEGGQHRFSRDIIALAINILRKSALPEGALDHKNWY